MLSVIRLRASVRGLASLFLIILVGTVSAAPNDDALELREALARTLERSPVLEVFPYRERMAEARVLQAGLRPNPEISAELENLAGSGAYAGTDVAQLTLALSQTIELGDKREQRTFLAQMNRDLLGVDYAIARLDVLGEAARRFIHVARDQALLELARQEKDMVERALVIAEKRVDTGRSSAAEASQARIANAQALVHEEHAEHELLTARVRLAAAWGELDPDFASVSASLFSLPAVPPFEALRAQLDEAPAMARYLTLDRVRAAEVRLAEANGRQDARVALGVRRFEETGDNALVLQFSMPLPFSNRNQGNVAAARAEREMSDAERRQTRIDIYATLFALYQELVHASTEVRVLKETALPEATQALATIESGYRAGRFSYLELIEARRSRLDVERAAIEAAAEFHSLLLELERLTGEPLVIAQTTETGE